MATGSSTLVEVGSDGGLVLATLAGDQAAFAALYDRFATRIHDFQLALLRDPYQAAEATYRTFQRAVAELNHLGEPSRLRPWLYAVAYRQATRRASAKPGDNTLNWASGAKPGADSQAEMWQAVPTRLKRQDRALLTLYLRHGLDVSELGSIVGLTGQRAQARLNELRIRLEPVLRPVLEAHLAPAQRSPGGHGFGRPNPTTAQMVDGAGCGTTTDEDPPPLRIAVPFAPPPPELRDEVLRHSSLSSAHEGLPRPRTRAAWVTTIVTVVVLITASVLFIHRNLERRPVIAVRFGPSSELALSTTVIDLGATSSTATITLSNTGGNQLAWHATPDDPWLKVSPSSGSLSGGQSQQLTVNVDRNALPEGDGRTQLKVSSADNQGQGVVAVALREERPPAIINARASNTRIGGYGCPTTSTITATVRDESEPVHVVLVGPGQQTQTMQSNGSTYFGRLGSGSGTDIIWRIVATDARNNTATSPAQVIANTDCLSRPAPVRSASPAPSSTPQDQQSSSAAEPSDGPTGEDNGSSSPSTGGSPGGTDNGSSSPSTGSDPGTGTDNGSGTDNGGGPGSGGDSGNPGTGDPGAGDTGGGNTGGDANGDGSGGNTNGDGTGSGSPGDGTGGGDSNPFGF